MELTSTQYNQIERYVGGEMEASEKEAFEATLLQDNELAEEVEAYKEIFALADSLEQKIGGIVQHSSEGPTSNKEILELLEKERKYWEEHHEPELKRMHGLAGPGEINKTGEERQGKVISINRKRWLAAAILIGILGSGSLTWWYIQPESNKAATAIHSKKADSGNIVNNRNGNGQEDLARKKTESPPITNNTVDDSAAKMQESPKKDLDKAEQQQLYAQNFVKDAPPKQSAELLMLKNGFEHYEKGSYKQASTEYEKVQKDVEDLTTRTTEDEEDEADRKRILFYAHYYNALSYMANNNAAKAIPELNKAMHESADNLSKIKTKWYLSLAYLKTGNSKKTEALLREIADNRYEGVYKAKAATLLDELERSKR
jgi:hypothetical protein